MIGDTSGVRVIFVDLNGQVSTSFSALGHYLANLSHDISTASNFFTPSVKPTLADDLLEFKPTMRGWREQCRDCGKPIPFGGALSDNTCRFCRRKRWADANGSRGRRAQRAGKRPRRTGAR